MEHFNVFHNDPFFPKYAAAGSVHFSSSRRGTNTTRFGVQLLLERAEANLEWKARSEIERVKGTDWLSLLKFLNE